MPNCVTIVSRCRLAVKTSESGVGDGQWREKASTGRKSWDAGAFWERPDFKASQEAAAKASAGKTWDDNLPWNN